MIGDNIEVSILAVGREKVRIGIKAPRSIPVLRTEIYHDVKHELDASEAIRAVEEALLRLDS
jgi:carbon storage regulator